MRRRFYQIAAMVLAPLIATGCPEDDSANPEGDTDTDTDADTDTDTDADTDVDYGVVAIRYLLSGSVTNAATGAPVQGIELEFQGFTTQSTKEGVWSIDAVGADYCGEDCTLDARDVDGEEHGNFEETQVDLDPTQTTHDVFEQFDIAVPMNRLDSEDTATPVEE